jgi:hypothetical protein
MLLSASDLSYFLGNLLATNQTLLWIYGYKFILMLFPFRWSWLEWRETKYFSFGYEKEYEMGGACSTNGDMRNAYGIWVGKPEQKRPLEDLGIDGKKRLEWILGK